MLLVVLAYWHIAPVKKKKKNQKQKKNKESLEFVSVEKDSIEIVLVER